MTSIDLIPRRLFSREHEQFRESFRRFLEAECLPKSEQWQKQQYVDRETWLRAGSLGFLCVTMPEQLGGAGVDRLYSVVMMEEQIQCGVEGPGWSLHSEIVANYLHKFGNDEQKRRWLPPMARGERSIISGSGVLASSPCTGATDPWPWMYRATILSIRRRLQSRLRPTAGSWNTRPAIIQPSATSTCSAATTM